MVSRWKHLADSREASLPAGSPINFWTTLLTKAIALALLAAPASAGAQTAPAASYEFLNVAELQNLNKGFAALNFAHAFAGKTDLLLAPLPNGFSGAKYVAPYRQNLELVNHQLAAVTAAGWELVQVSTTIIQDGHLYLFRRPKP